jgi:flagellar hook protein FlgE
MSLYNVLRTGVSGMEAQSYKLSTVADNVANANTIGYKRADTEFSSLVLDAGPGNYSSGAVNAKVHYEISRQGGLSYTLSKTDVAVQGAGFFVVQDHNGADYLTRAGSFVIDGQSGNLVNAGGFALMGFPSVAGKEPVITLNGTAGLEPIDIDYMNMRATASTAGNLRVNLDEGAAVNTGLNAGDNQVGSSYTFKSSIQAFDDLGRPKTLDVYWTKVVDYDASTTPATAPVWEVVVYDQSTRSNAIGTDFPYGNPNPPLGADAAAAALDADADQAAAKAAAIAAAGADPVLLNAANNMPDSIAYLSRARVTFDPTNGGMSDIETLYPSPTDYPLLGGYTGPVNPLDPTQQAILKIQLPDAKDPLDLNISFSTQLAADYEPLEIEINGNQPATVQNVSISEDGRVFALYEDGSEVEFYRLPLANVPAPDQMDPEAGNVYRITPGSGDIRIALPEQAGNGKLVVGAVEQSNVDLASELTDMIIAQRAYTANSKTVQTAGELLDVLMGLKR